MTRKPEFGEADADGETLHADDDAGHLLHDFVVETPFYGREGVQDVGPEDDAEDDGEGWFGHVQAVADEVAEEGPGDEEAGQDEVGEMGPWRLLVWVRIYFWMNWDRTCGLKFNHD